jgi:hypothetical protein
MGRLQGGGCVLIPLSSPVDRGHFQPPQPGWMAGVDESRKVLCVSVMYQGNDRRCNLIADGLADTVECIVGAFRDGSSGSFRGLQDFPAPFCSRIPCVIVGDYWSENLSG